MSAFKAIFGTSSETSRDTTTSKVATPSDDNSLTGVKAKKKHLKWARSSKESTTTTTTTTTTTGAAGTLPTPPAETENTTSSWWRSSRSTESDAASTVSAPPAPQEAAVETKKHRKLFKMLAPSDTNLASSSVVSLLAPSTDTTSVTTGVQWARDTKTVDKRRRSVDPTAVTSTALTAMPGTMESSLVATTETTTTATTCTHEHATVKKAPIFLAVNVSDIFGIGKVAEMMLGLYLAHDSFLSRQPFWLQCVVLFWEGLVVLLILWGLLRAIGMAEIVVQGADDLVRGTFGVLGNVFQVVTRIWAPPPPPPEKWYERPF